MQLPPHLRFEIERLKSAILAALGPKARTPDAAHRMCPSCRALIDREASSCPFCGAATRPARARGGDPGGRILGVIPVPSTATSVIVAVNVGLYSLSWYLTQAAAASGHDTAASLGEVRFDVLFRLGAKVGPAVLAGQWWRLVTAIFLHGGLLHIAMNLWCLVDVGSEVESLFSTSKFIVVYLATGVAGFLLSLAWNPKGSSVGASGAILGLVGVLISASFHHGHLGKLYRGQLWRWVIYVLIFGLFFAVDNAAHIGGLAAGALLGYLVPEGEPMTRPGETFWNTLAVLSVVVIAGSFALMALQMNQRGG